MNENMRMVCYVLVSIVLTMISWYGVTKPTEEEILYNEACKVNYGQEWELVFAKFQQLCGKITEVCVNVTDGEYCTEKRIYKEIPWRD